MDAGKPLKRKLDPKIIADIIHYVTKRCGVSETAVRSSITTKCADENKMLRQRKSKALAKQDALGLLRDLNKLESLDISDNSNNSPNLVKPKYSHAVMQNAVMQNAQNPSTSARSNDEMMEENGAHLEDNKENVKNATGMNVTSPKYGKKKAHTKRTFGHVHQTN